MDARIISYRRGRHTEHTDQFVVSVDGVKTRDDARKLVGKRIYWETPAKNRINGKVIRAHGGNGTVIARFDKGLPGQALGTGAVLE